MPDKSGRVTGPAAEQANNITLNWGAAGAGNVSGQKQIHRGAGSQ